ncbi:MAG: type IX secretion system sortase PorU [Chitinophagales bacterium]|nr:type IX secretion system sortase PorU [Chitinophagales bacterium]MDW8417893.1 type IX secretion system sortase PorU [Chitinophagales bacterium]
MSYSPPSMRKSKRILPFFIVFVGFCSSEAQTTYPRNIRWHDTLKTIIDYRGGTYKQVTFDGASHHERMSLLPIYVEDVPIATAGEITADLQSPVYAPVKLNNECIAYIKSEPQINARLATERKKHFAHIEIVPFRKNAQGETEKLVSFVLQLHIKPTPQKRGATSYATHSVLASGTWYKLGITAGGIYKIDYNFLKNTLGVNPSEIVANKLAIFGNGGGMIPDENAVPRPDDLLENPTLLIDQNNNNRIDEGDYLLFYAEGPDKWHFNSSNGTFTHEKNLYSDKNHYFLTINAGTGKRVQLSNEGGTANTFLTTFDDYAFYENDTEQPLQSGKSWLGDRMTSFDNVRSFSFYFPGLVTSSPVLVRSKVAANSKTTTSFTITVNGTQILNQTVPPIQIGGSYPNATNRTLQSANFNASSDQLNFTITFTGSTGSTGYIDYVEAICKRNLSMAGNELAFRSAESVGTGKITQFTIGNANPALQVWDVTDPGNIKQMSGAFSGSQYVFTVPTPALRQFVAFTPGMNFPVPEYTGAVPNQDLHGIGQPDMVIVTHENFLSASNELGNFHRQVTGLSVEVVPVGQIYNEFSSGRKDISAIRDFMRMLYVRAGNDVSLLPRFLLLMGDGSYDPKNRISGNQEFIPTYQTDESDSPLSSYTSDDFFGLLDDDEGGDINNGSEKIDIAVGRLPVATELEAITMVNKIKNYKNPSPDASCIQVTDNNSWRNVITFVADDGDYGIHFNSSDDLAEDTRTLYPEYNFDKIYLDAYKQVSTSAGARYPDVNTAIINRLYAGTLILNWVGHGGETNWADERIFNMSEIVKLENKKLPLFITATCEFSRFDLQDRTAGEWLIVNGKGGAIASFTTVRLVYSSANDVLNRKAFEYMFQQPNGVNYTLGEILMLTKNNANTSIDNTRKFVLLGDPALTLNYPRYNVVTTQVNNVPVSQPHDTLKALAKITIRGEVRDDNNQKLQNFNGTVFPVVYDKISKLSTLGNDNDSPIKNFELYRNVLFKGKASVTNGEFSFTFIVPKDIVYQYGPGRISYYAEDGKGNDANGYTHDIIVGGAADTFTADANGPVVKIFMNDEKFVFGGTTNASPVLLVKLEDESGINTAGNGIGHDLAVVLDNNQQNKIILNDYYESELDDYRRGTIRYPFSKLSEGRHTLKVKAWDIHNNSSEEYTEFVVVSDAKLALKHVYNYPNPFTTRTSFMFEHNRSCEDLNVSVQIYTVSGKLVKNIQQTIYCEGYRVNEIEWDGKDDYGNPIGKGVYVYKLSVRDSRGNQAHKFEKLVLLR